MCGIGLPELLIILIVTVFWFWGLQDLVRSEFTGKMPITWLLIIIFMPVVGFILYFWIGRRQRIPFKKG
jgi:hypothetical protein